MATTEPAVVGTGQQRSLDYLLAAGYFGLIEPVSRRRIYAAIFWMQATTSLRGAQVQYGSCWCLGGFLGTKKMESRRRDATR